MATIALAMPIVHLDDPLDSLSAAAPMLPHCDPPLPLSVVASLGATVSRSSSISVPSLSSFISISVPSLSRHTPAYSPDLAAQSLSTQSSDTHDPPSASASDDSPQPSPAFVTSSSSSPVLFTAKPLSPTSRPEELKDRNVHSLLYPPDPFVRVESCPLPVYILHPNDVAAALDHSARQPLPSPEAVFPWLHGLHPVNLVQQSFFKAKRRARRRPPNCMRGISLVKADGDLTRARLKGAVAPSEIIDGGADGLRFLDVDPRNGFSVRNFHIQSAKAAMTSDVIIYGDNSAKVLSVASAVAAAQSNWRQAECRPHFSSKYRSLCQCQCQCRRQSQSHCQCKSQCQCDCKCQSLSSSHHHAPLPKYNTFICTGSFDYFEEFHPDIVAIDQKGRRTGRVVDMFTQERLEMHNMARVSEISHNVWMGPTPDLLSDAEHDFDLLIECSDVPTMELDLISRLSELAQRPQHSLSSTDSRPIPYRLVLASIVNSPPAVCPNATKEAILESCRWIYHLAHGTLPPSAPHPVAPDDECPITPIKGCLSEVEHNTVMADSHGLEQDRAPMKILLHCGDGYTESTLLGIAYLTFSTGRSIADAWLHLHTVKQRNFFAYQTDVAVLNAVAPRLLVNSPANVSLSGPELGVLIRHRPAWLSALDGSFPSRILDHMYLGNLAHASSRCLLHALGIRQILSVGERPVWRDGEMDAWGADNVLNIEGVQDNGIDSLTGQFERCLQFIDRGRSRSTATLVHCRVGVSRSATVCIAETMRVLGLSFPRAYCFVRARRLNVIIQPHLRFVYELLRWEQDTLRRCDDCFKREMEWAEIAREVALMNRPYLR